MKKLIIVIPLILSAGVLVTNAEDTVIRPSESSSTKVYIISTKTRPRDASALEPNLSCYYSMGSLSFEFGTPEGTAQLEIINFETSQSITETFPSSQVHYTYIGTEPGTYSILVTTDHNEYSATIVME